MSGGHFGYIQTQLLGFAEELDIEIRQNKYNFDKETLANLKQILNQVNTSIPVIKDVDYLFSGRYFK